MRPHGEETEARLQYMRDRVSDEAGEEREARLQQMKTSQRERRSTETADETEARLQQDRENHRERRSTQTADETEARLQRDRHHYREQRALGALSQSQLPLIQQHFVQAKITSTCSEAFAGLHLLPGCTECARCARDKHTPKLYSNGNNYHLPYS